MSFTYDGEFAITMHQGNSGALKLEYFQDKAFTIPEDFTDFAFTLRVAKSLNSPSVLVLTEDDEHIVIDVNRVRVEFRPEDTELMKPGTYPYQLTRSNGNVVKTMIDSTITILPELK